jgi:16S rRNA (uracil1498-N3)-methyltransferase
MHHFVVDQAAIDGLRVRFSSAQRHQIARVLRLRDGDEVIALDGRGAQYLVRLTVEKAVVAGEIVAPAVACREPGRRVTLLVAPPRGERWEWLLQKATEVGVSRFVPLSTRYSQPGSTTIRPRHHEIVREAVEQCRRLLVPEIATPQPLVQALHAAANTAGLTILLWEDHGSDTLAAVLGARSGDEAEETRLVVGPEGGFHPDEVALARELGIAVAGLGPLILRSETAAMVAAAIALHASPPRTHDKQGANTLWA